MAPRDGPWNNDAAREPEAQRRAKVGAAFFAYFLPRLAKSESRVRRETESPAPAVKKTSEVSKQTLKSGPHLSLIASDRAFNTGFSK